MERLGGREMAKVVFEREDQFANKMRNYQILANEKIIGEIANGGKETIDLEPGTYTFQIKVDWCVSRTYTVELGGTNTMHFKCGSPLKGWRILLSSVSMSKENKFVYLEKVGS